jgi:choline dehydrogenase-like flavoprotein
VLYRLSEIGDWSVLLLEAGEEEPPETDVPAFVGLNLGSRFDWQYQTEPHQGYCGGRSCTWNAGKVLGGGSVLNGMIYNRGNARSYDLWEELGKDPVCLLIALACCARCSDYQTLYMRCDECMCVARRIPVISLKKSNTDCVNCTPVSIFGIHLAQNLS